MVLNNSVSRLSIFSVLLSFELLFIPNPFQGVQAQMTPQTSDVAAQTDAFNGTVQFDPPPDQGTGPSTSRRGTSRGPCNLPSNQQAITLLPNTNNGLGLTVNPHPTFFVYIPQTSAHTALLSLMDNETGEMIEVPVDLNATETIIQIDLPKETKPLQVGQTYNWSVGLICQSGAVTLAPNSVLDEGEIKRVELEPSLNNPFGNEPSLELAALYADNGIWFDTLTTLAQLKRSQPNDLAYTTAWTELLKSVELEDIATYPLATPPVDLHRNL